MEIKTIAERMAEMMLTRLEAATQESEEHGLEGLVGRMEEGLLAGMREAGQFGMETMMQREAEKEDRHPHGCSECDTTMHRQGKKNEPCKP